MADLSAFPQTIRVDGQLFVLIEATMTFHGEVFLDCRYMQVKDTREAELDAISRVLTQRPWEV